MVVIVRLLRRVTLVVWCSLGMTVALVVVERQGMTVTLVSGDDGGSSGGIPGE